MARLSNWIGDWDEFRLIRRWTSRWSKGKTLQRGGLGEDAALFSLAAGRKAVVSTDLMIEGVHFDRRWIRPDEIGWRLLARGLSDLASVGATPRACLVSAALPPRTPLAFTDGFFRGLYRLTRKTHMQLIGGDTACHSGRLLFDVVVLGELDPRRYLSRLGATPGDRLYVTGPVGDAAMALKRLQRGASRSRLERTMPQALRRLVRPQPRLAEGQWAGRLGATAMIDISDGLLADLGHLLAASGVGARLRWEDIPLSAEFRNTTRGCSARTAMTLALAGGDDYELLLAVPRSIPVRRTGICPIGWVIDGSGKIELVDSKDRPLALPQLQGYRHFS